MIRSGQDRARVSGMFDAPERASKVLAQAGFEAEQGEMLLEREILSNGKSRVFVNSRPATVALLKDLAPQLGDIHGQHDQQLLFEPHSQLGMLDAFAGLRDLRKATGELFLKWKDVNSQIGELEGADQEK